MRTARDVERVKGVFGARADREVEADEPDVTAPHEEEAVIEAGREVAVARTHGDVAAGGAELVFDITASSNVPARTLMVSPGWANSKACLTVAKGWSASPPRCRCRWWRRTSPAPTGHVPGQKCEREQQPTAPHATSALYRGL